MNPLSHLPQAGSKQSDHLNLCLQRPTYQLYALPEGKGRQVDSQSEMTRRSLSPLRVHRSISVRKELRLRTLNSIHVEPIETSWMDSRTYSLQMQLTRVVRSVDPHSIRYLLENRPSALRDYVGPTEII